MDLFRCIGPSIEILKNNGHTIIFQVEDSRIGRAEFVIRRCNSVRILLNRCILLIELHFPI